MDAQYPGSVPADHNDRSKLILEVSAGLVVLGGLLVFVLYGGSSGPANPLPTPTPEVQSLNLLPVEDMSNATGNPADKLQSANPYNAQANPLNDVYKNPFE